MTNIISKVIALFGLGNNSAKAIINIGTLALVVGIHPAHAQAGLAANLPVLTQPPEALIAPPARIQEIRSAQNELARASGINIRQHEFGERSPTGLGGVPPEFRNRRIETQFDLISLIEALYPYYGFSGSETLEYEDKRDVFGQTQYYFRQYIDGIETSEPVAIYVDNQSKQVVQIVGAPQIDRLFDRTPLLPAQQAIDIAIRYVQQNEEINDELYDLNGSHDADIFYRNSGPNGVLVPYWRVYLDISDRFPGAFGQSLFIGPNGEVETDRISRP